MILVSNLKNRGVEIKSGKLDPEEQVSVDLAIGEMYQRSGYPDWLHIDETLVIPPGACVVVQTREKIRMPNNAFGPLSTKGGIGAKGILAANTKLDPLFDGHLNVPIFNVSRRKVELRKGDAFCSIAFWKTEGPVIGSATRNAIKPQPRTVSRFKDFVDQNFAHIVTALVAIATSLIPFFYSLYTGGLK